LRLGLAEALVLSVDFLEDFVPILVDRREPLDFLFQLSDLHLVIARGLGDRSCVILFHFLDKLVEFANSFFFLIAVALLLLEFILEFLVLFLLFLEFVFVLLKALVVACRVH